jgi:excisionase family DNA binding protein
MNPEVQQLYAEYLALTEDRQQAAMLTLADALLTKHVEHVFVEPEHCCSYGVKEVALRLGVESQDVYHLILAGVLTCFRSGTAVRVPLSEIERYEDDVQPTTALILRPKSNAP